MAGEMKTIGTRLYFLDTDDTTVITLTNVSNVQGLGGQKGEIDTTNLDSTSKEYLVGMEDPGTVTFDINFAPDSAVHQSLIDLKDDGSRVQWCMGLSNGTSAPTVSSGDLVAPTSSRGNYMFLASVQQMTLSVQTDDIYRYNVSLRVSGQITYNAKSP